jgi:hypothetical protein
MSQDEEGTVKTLKEHRETISLSLGLSLTIGGEWWTLLVITCLLNLEA